MTPVMAPVPEVFWPSSEKEQTTKVRSFTGIVIRKRVNPLGCELAETQSVVFLIFFK
jgi:hypothetical protein